MDRARKRGRQRQPEARARSGASPSLALRAGRAGVVIGHAADRAGACGGRAAAHDGGAVETSVSGSGVDGLPPPAEMEQDRFAGSGRLMGGTGAPLSAAESLELVSCHSPGSGIARSRNSPARRASRASSPRSASLSPFTSFRTASTSCGACFTA